MSLLLGITSRLPTEMNKTVNSKTLPLSLAKRLGTQNKGSNVPLAFLRRLGEVDEGTALRVPIPARSWGFDTTEVCIAGNNFIEVETQQLLTNEVLSISAELVDVATSHAFNVSAVSQYELQEAFENGQFISVAAFYDKKNSKASNLHTDINSNFNVATTQGTNQYNGFVYPEFISQAQISVNSELQTLQGIFISFNGQVSYVKRCEQVHISASKTVPLQFYPIPIEALPPQKNCPCGPRPDSNKLTLAFNTQTIQHDASMLPFSFACIRKDFIPNLKSYVMQNIVSASVNGEAIEILSASITTDIESFCWQGRISLYPDDFVKINMDNRAIGDEAEITVNINGEQFVFLAEDYSDNREFGKKTYTVSGRSTSAKLDSDYAKTRSGTIETDLYARQIADAQLEFLPYTLSWQVVDWFVPGGSYSITDKTPLDTLIEIAKAAGGFIQSDPALAQLTIKPKWKAPAWELENVTADVMIPASVILSISGQKRTNKCCNSVFVWADHKNGKGADVYRTGTDRSVRASAQIHALYTDLSVHQLAGIAVLSDSGAHKMETVKLPWSQDYAIPRANLGEIWQINEPNGYWRGVVISVDISINQSSDGAISVWQTLVIDRYMDI